MVFSLVNNQEKKYTTKIQSITNFSNLSVEMREAADLIKSNEVVAFPTETVYGLGANAFSAEAVSKIFQAKGRPADNPIIVHVFSYEMFIQVTSEIARLDLVKKLQKRFWPGPLTLIVQKSNQVPYITTGNLETVAVRMPNNPIALALIRESNLPIAAPSANISGSPSPTTALDVFEDMNGKIPLIIDGGKSEIGLESTVLDISNPVKKPIILRPGKITQSEIEECLGTEVEIFDISTLKTGNGEVKARSPGMKYRHYAPKAEVELLSDFNSFKAMFNEKRMKKDKIGLILDNKYLSRLKTESLLASDVQLYHYSTLEEFASNLYFKLREMDKKQVSVIIILFNETTGIGKAIQNRLLKASTKK